MERDKIGADDLGKLYGMNGYYYFEEVVESDLRKRVEIFEEGSEYCKKGWNLRRRVGIFQEGVCTGFVE
jgi:hypothetical protein